MERKEINFDELKKSINRRTGDLAIKNIRIIRRFEDHGRNYTEFLYDSLYETNHHYIYDDMWFC